MNTYKTGADSTKVATEYQNYGKLSQLGLRLSDILAAQILQHGSLSVFLLTQLTHPALQAHNCFINPDIEVSTWSQL